MKRELIVSLFVGLFGAAIFVAIAMSFVDIL